MCEAALTETNAKDRILQNAVLQFSAKGFHGTNMRDIAAASECSMPTLYYHYKSKGDLFEEIVVNQFLKVTERMNLTINLAAEPLEIYCQMIKSRKELNGMDRDVYKMALKVWLGFEDNGKAREHVLEWESRRASTNRQFIDKGIINKALREDVTDILINYMENLINRIILLDEDVDEEKVKRQLELLFHIGK